MSKVTIVVPTYNVEAYIAKCLDSLVNQNCDDYEVLAINDGSPANEQSIIDRYVAKYPFIHSVVKPNGGYGSVLKKAMEMIDTEYMMICDPDDYLYPHTVKTLLNLMEDHGVDLVIGAKTLVYSDNDEQVYDSAYNEAKAALIDEHVYIKGTSEYDQLFFVEPSPHAKLYKTAFVRNYLFPERVSYTDNILYFLTLIRTARVLYTKQPLAYYLIDRAGNTRTDVKLKVIDSWITVLGSILEQAKNYDEIPDIFYYRMFEGYKHVFNDKIDNVVASDDEFKQKLEELYQLIELLIPHARQVRKYYRHYNDYRIIEQLKDQLLLNPRFSRSVYQKLVEQKCARRTVK